MNTPAPLSALLWDSIQQVLHVLLHGPDAAHMLQPTLHLTVAHITVLPGLCRRGRRNIYRAANVGIHLHVVGMLSTIFPPDLTPATTVTVRV